jgi:hypothetical protein
MDPTLSSYNLKQVRRSNDVSFNKNNRSVDTTIDMAFCGKVHNRIDVIFSADSRNQRSIANIRLNEFISVRIDKTLYIFDIPSVG